MRPIVFSTLVQDNLRSIVREANGLHLDIFDVFLEPLEIEFQAGVHARRRGVRTA